MDCEHEICLDEVNAAVLVDYIVELDRWSRRTWGTCEPFAPRD